MEWLTLKTVIIMDDYHGFCSYRNGQFRAWAEFVAAHRLVYLRWVQSACCVDLERAVRSP
jgi:hypothetical protein